MQDSIISPKEGNNPKLNIKSLNKKTLISQIKRAKSKSVISNYSKPITEK